jgi:hypothetical protein|tara:strand:+ start:1859 stop:2080 length:222 start_codon:yes stop_codon:yes gene_type:complete
MEIIKNKPVPPRRRNGPPRSAKYDIADRMEVGDCVAAPTHKEVVALYNRLARMSKKCVTRKLPDGTIGVWRTE